MRIRLALIVSLGTCMTLLSSCEDETVDGLQKFERYVERNRIGRGANYWLEMHNYFGEWEKVALVMGYFDDEEGCTDIAAILHDRYDRIYRCVEAN